MPQICDFPSDERHAEDSGSNPRSWVPEASMLTTRPPKPLTLRACSVCCRYLAVASKGWYGLDVPRDTSPPPAPLACTFMMPLSPVTNWEPHGVTLAGYCYAMRPGMQVQIATPYVVSHLQRYGVTVRGNVTSVYPRLRYTSGAVVVHNGGASVWPSFCFIKKTCWICA
jgi:hypothetical protein